uniref:NADH dehydrogenase subunit 6 n=1 Tax=Halteria grandinella TaxID=5974 RepID=A0A7T0M4R7_HALGN|nr:NADH dehydrogenase subunit 6 [Halteria grandinella]QPL16011.1 NADH dehydrogenase subunit 6 [Halteria grandinella]
MLNELFILQILSIITLIFFINSINIITLWYLAGIYLMILGIILLTDDADIFVGFLWVIDLGVGLIFFIFILHFSNFLHQKSFFDLSSRYFFLYLFLFLFIFLFFYFLSNANDLNLNYQLKKTWFFFISYYNYYSFYNTYHITDLNLLREIYFYNNSFGFFVINFMLFYGIFGSINLCFLIKRIFVFLNLSQLRNLNFLNEINSTFFIRNQNFLRQQNTSVGTRVWLKKKMFKI